MIDYHLHTARCCHAAGTLEEYLTEAEKKCLEEIGFADHFPLGLLGYEPRKQVTMHPEELETYMNQVNVLKKRSSSISIKLGIEIDYLPGYEDRINELLGRFEFDYVIGSIHFIGDWDFTHPVYADDYKHKDLEEIYRHYYELVSQAIKSGLFDIIGHIDVVKKFGYRPASNFDSTRLAIARLLKETNTCLELNTAGKDAPVGEFYPDRDFLALCCAEGVDITLGSDAHAPDQVGRYFTEALELLKQTGYRSLTLFKQREKIAQPL